MVGPRHGALSVATAGYYANVLLKRLIVVGTVLSAFGCMGSGLPPSVWPPSNFRIVVEELQTVGMSAHILRRWQVDASGLVIYGTSSKPLVDPESGASWPVFDRLSIYRLEPKCVRALSRRLDRLGISEIVVPSSAVAIGEGPGLSVQWQAFGSKRVLPSNGRLRGPMAEIMAVIASHLPPGEAFQVEMTRPIAPVLHGVPTPGLGGLDALQAYQELIAQDPEDEQFIIAAYALACSVGEREQAEQLLASWQRLKRSQPRPIGFQDDPEQTIDARIKSLSSLLPKR